jgi:hypothetical protein
MMLDRLVALKLGRPDAQSLIIESRRTGAVRDACAVAIYGMGSHQGREYVVAERVSGTLLREVASPSPQLYLARLRTLVAAIARAHAANVSIGDLSGTSILVDGSRLILGRLSLSQIPAGAIMPSEDPVAADLYGIGCVAIEMAGGLPAPGDETPPPRLADLRPDLPTELSDLVEWLLAKQQPRSVADVLAQLDVLIERVGSTHARAIRVLIVDDDGFRARRWWSLVRRAHAAAVVEIASEGTDAAHKLNRDHPDLVFIDGELRGVMHAFELCRYARNLEMQAQLIVIGATAERDREAFSGVSAELLPDDNALPSAIQDRVRGAGAERPGRKKRPTMITG